jgi:SAM-dependent methyltransferase
MVSYYSNAKSDSTGATQARALDESNVRAMYEFAPYPDLGAGLKDMSLYLDVLRPDLMAIGKVRFLDVGCGTGHIIVGVAKQYPSWQCYGIDLSEASLRIASALAAKHGAKVTLSRGSYLDPLPYSEKFHVISAMGTIHHCADPVAALRNLKQYLEPSGFLLLHLYGMRGDRAKFDIKECLNILEPDLASYDHRFRYYDALMKHQRRNWLKRLALTTPFDVYTVVRDWLRNLGRRRAGISWSPPFDTRYREISAPWIDHFCHPCERAYEVSQVRELIESSGFRVVHMLKQGRENHALIPSEWRERYERLDDWNKWRLSELLAVGGGSFAMVLQRS